MAPAHKAAHQKCHHLFCTKAELRISVKDYSRNNIAGPGRAFSAWIQKACQSISFQSLIATKAARVCLAARGEPVLEFGLRRAQGVDGALAASRAAYIGGCAATSNVLAAKLYGIPVRGTHAHSWVMSFDDEREAFRAYAEAMPNNCVFLVDTYDKLEGVRRAVEAGRLLRERGHEMVGIRLDSGDLAWLSVEARKILDEAGFPNAVIVASNDLDEHIIASLKEQGAMINVWAWARNWSRPTINRRSAACTS